MKSLLRKFLDRLNDSANRRHYVYDDRLKYWRVLNELKLDLRAKSS